MTSSAKKIAPAPNDAASSRRTPRVSGDRAVAAASVGVWGAPGRMAVSAQTTAPMAKQIHNAPRNPIAGMMRNGAATEAARAPARFAA